MILLERTTSEHPGFVALVRHLDTYLAHIDGDEHAFYAQYNKIATLQNVVVALDGDMPIGCGAFKPFDENSVEVKRMYVLPERRGKGGGALGMGGLGQRGGGGWDKPPVVGRGLATIAVCWKRG